MIKRIATAALFSSILLAPAMATAQTFQAPVQLGLVGGFAAADVNGDGALDLLAVRDSVLWVWVAQAPGQFSAAKASGIGPSTFPMNDVLAVGDFNGDGMADAAVAAGPYGLIVMSGRGNGSFDPGGMVPLQTSMGRYSVRSAATADLNGDGVLDFALTVSAVTDGVVTMAGIAIATGDGAGGFTPAGFAALTPDDSCAHLVIGQFSADRHLDVMASCDLAGVVVALGDGAGHVAPPVPVAAPGIASMESADFNGDGVGDLVYVRGGSVFRLKVNGAAPAASVSIQLPDLAAVTAVATGDFNGDGHADIVAMKQDGTAVLLFGDGHGFFQPAAPIAAIHADRGHWDVLAADLDGDGFSDLWFGGSIFAYVARYQPTDEERATHQFTRVQTSIDDVAGVIAGVTASLGQWQSTDFGRLSSLDATISSRASQASVDAMSGRVDSLALATTSGLTAIDLKVQALAQVLPSGGTIDALRASVNALAATAASIQTTVETSAAAGMRVVIERALSKGTALVVFMLPANAGGQLEAVRQIVSEAIDGVRLIGGNVKKASADFAKGETAFAGGDYAGAYAKYVKAYQQLF